MSRRCLILIAALALALPGPAPLTAQATAWEQVETPHFLFLFEPRDRASVNELLTFSEEVYTAVSGFFGSYPAKVPCILRGRRDDASGVTFPLRSRIDLYLTAPSDHLMGARAENWLRILLTHELTHFVHQSLSTGIYHALSSVFGRDFSSYSMAFLPGWALEGPAVYDETVFTTGGRGRNPLFEIYTKAPVIEGKLFSLEQAGYPSAFPPPGRIYVAGYALVDYLQETFGQDTLPRIMDAYLDFPFFGPWAAIEKVTGRKPSAIFADMSAALAARYAPGSTVRGGSLLTPRRVGDWTRPQSTAMGLYVYHASPESFPAIVRWDPVSGEEKAIVKVDLTDSTSYSATADGKTIWFSSLITDFRRASDVTTTAELFVHDVETGIDRQVTHDSHLWHPAISADGASLVAVQGAGPYSRLVSVDQQTGAMRVLFSRAEGNVYTPAFSPDGKRLAFVVNLRGIQDVYLADFEALKASAVALPDPHAVVSEVNADAAQPVLGPDADAEYFPSFIDDERLLFSSDRGGSLSLYAFEISTGAIAKVQSDPVAAISGIRDGDSLLYTSYASTGACLKLTPLGELSAAPIDAGAAVPPPAPAAVPWTGGSVPAKQYVDWAPPYLWLPNLVVSQTGPSTGDLSIGAGALVMGESLLGATSWSADLAWLAGPEQPVGGVSVSTEIGPLGVHLQSRLTYQYEGSWTQSLSNSLQLSYPLFAQALLTMQTSLSLSLGLRHDTQLVLPTPFTAAQSLTAPSGAWFSSLAVPVGIDYQWQALGGGLDFNPPLAVDAWLQATAYLPVLSLAAAVGDVGLFAAVNIPSPFAHQVVKVGLKAAYALGRPASSSFSDSYTVPRGFPLARFRQAAGGALASVDYLAPIALLDQPLPFGLALTAVGVGLHAEAIGDFEAAPFSFSPLPAVFVGADITIRLAWGRFSYPLGFGLAAAISAVNPGAFDPATDLKGYLFWGFDSFGGAARAPAGSGATLLPGR